MNANQYEFVSTQRREGAMNFNTRMNTDGHGFALPQKNAWNASSNRLEFQFERLATGQQSLLAVLSRELIAQDKEFC